MILCTAVCMCTVLVKTTCQDIRDNVNICIRFSFLWNLSFPFSQFIIHYIVSVYLVSKKSCNQGAVDVTKDEPDQNNNQVFYKRSGEGIPDEHELIQ